MKMFDRIKGFNNKIKDENMGCNNEERSNMKRNAITTEWRKKSTERRERKNS